MTNIIVRPPQCSSMLGLTYKFCNGSDVITTLALHLIRFPLSHTPTISLPQQLIEQQTNMSTNPFPNRESRGFVDGASSVPSPICHTKLPQASASVPALNDWRDLADPVSTVLLTEEVEGGGPRPSTSVENFGNLTDVSQQDFNGETPSSPVPAEDASRPGSGTVTGSTTAISPPSIGISGLAPFQMSQRRVGRSSRPPAPLFSSAQRCEPTTGNFDSSLPVSHIVIAGAQACEPKFKPPWWTALSPVNTSCSIWAFAGLINIPFLTLFFMDIIGTHYRKSKFYRQNLDLRFGIPGPIVFQTFYIAIGLGTAFANILYLGTFIEYVGRKWGKDKNLDKTESDGTIRKVLFGKGDTLRGPGVPVLVCGIIFGVLLFVAGPVVAPFVAIRTHTLPPLVSGPALCSDYRYKTTIILRASDGEATTNLTDLGGRPLYSSATFYSGSTVPFTMDLIPRRGPLDTFPSTYLFIFNPASIHENDLVALGISNVSVAYDLGQHKYEFRYDRGQGGPELVDQDAMHDDPDDAESLSFPHLIHSIHSMERDTWTSHTPLIQPHVQFVRGFSIATDILLKTESDPTGAINCTVVKMCARDSMDFMLADPPTFESILVPVGRFFIEVVRFSEDFCKPNKFE